MVESVSKEGGGEGDQKGGWDGGGGREGREEKGRRGIGDEGREEREGKTKGKERKVPFCFIHMYTHCNHVNPKSIV